MCKFFRILGILLSISSYSWAQNSEITIIWENDTAWYVNPSYDVNHHPQYTPAFTFPVFTDASYQSFRIDWGDGSPVTEALLTSVEHKNIRHLYEKTGVFEMQIHLFANPTGDGVLAKTFYKKVMNRSLEASFRLSPVESRRCMEWGGDSVKLILIDHDNPPGTKYEILVNSDIEKLPTAGESVFVTTWIDNKSDSAWIVSLKPTGIYGATVGINTTWVHEGITLNTQPRTWETFYSFKTPNLRDIYHFADSLREGESLENFKICTSNEVSVLGLDSAILAQYQFRFASNPDVFPFYQSVNNKLFFDVKYFWTDSAPTKDTHWELVTEQAEYVDTANTIKFNKAGFYKMRIEAYNQCGYDPRDGSTLLYVDSLWTDSVKDQTDKRYFQVFEQGKDKIECRKDSICSPTGRVGEVVIVDRNVRLSYDAPPSYKFTVTVAKEDGPAEVTDFMALTRVYKGGKVITRDLETAGCDSTEIVLSFQEIGDYSLELTRSTVACDPIVCNFDVYIGAKPLSVNNLIKDTLFIKYAFEYNMEGDFYEKCDSFSYTLQQNIWTDNNFATDSVYYYFRKGNVQKDTVLNYSKLIYDFDSVGNTFNMIQTKAHNYCGWGDEIAAEFYTRTRPDIALFRDSLPVNDSLCLKFDYDYFLGGLLPETYELRFESDRATYVEGTLLAGNEEKNLGTISDAKFRVNHQVAGKTMEYITIINGDMPNCWQKYRDSLEVIVAPDPVVYRDSILYCESLAALETGKLFAHDHKEFKKAEWTWNKINSTEKFPEFNFTPDVDTLCYKLSNSKGCYRGGQLVFKSRKAPDLKLAKEFSVCLPDTIKDFKAAGYVTYTDSPEMALSVYKTAQAAANLLCSPGGGCAVFPLTPFSDDTLSLIYVVKNAKTDTAFITGCVVEDTVDLLLHRPLLDIRKADTLPPPWDTYNFSSMSGFIDTSYLVPASLMWKILPPNSGYFSISSVSDRLFGQQYKPSNPDKTLDELYFELSAQTRCGEAMTDTLVVVVAHGKLEGYKDIICIEGSYPLWDKVKSSFIDEATLTWEICYPTDPAKQGTLSAPAIGSSVTYTPYTGAGRSDSVRICVKGEFDGVPGSAVTDTIVLKINQAPEITVTADTLIAEDHEVNILKISNEWFKTTNIVSYKIDEIITANNGMQINDTVYYFTGGDINTSTENRYARLRILMDGLTGCPQVSQEFTFLDLCPADFEFPEPLELCAGDVVSLNSIYDQVKGFDEYTVKRWTLEGDSPQGTLDGDSTHYTSPLTAGSRSIKLETSKSFKTYKGNSKIGILPVVRSVNIVVHSEPSLVLNHVRDTLCREQDQLEILRTWVSVTPDFYRDSIRLNGDVFNADYEYRMNAAGGGEDRVVFTVGQGSCTKWVDKIRDTLFLYRLPEMITGNFSIPSICEMETPAIDVTGLGVAAEAKNVYWTGTGGIVSGGMPPQFIPTVNSRENGSLTLHVQPPKGCPEDTLRQEFDIYRMPSANLESDTVCRIVGQPVTVNVNAESGVNVLDIRKIDWYRKGNGDILETTAGLAALNYVVNRQDSIAGTIELVARVWPVSPCDSWSLYDTVEIVLQNQPQIIFNNLTPSVCQGEETDLSGIISAQNTSSVTWSKKPTTAGTLNGTLYNPGEYWGNAAFILRADGLHGCPQLTKDVALTINYAPVPQGNVETPVQCQNDTVYFNTTTTPGIAAIYVWNFGDNSPEVQGAKASHVYAGAGEFQVQLTGKYGSCERRAELSVRVNEKPSAIFTPDAQVSIGTPVAFVSESVPSDVSCKWYFDHGTGTGSPCYHIFTGNSGERKVILEVTTDKGCQDTVSHVLLAVNKPVADFVMKVDSCRGVVDFTNLSERNFADATWHFGNGTSPSADWEPLQQVYRRIYNDTVYDVKLVLKNVAGSDSLILPVKMVSKLKAKFDVMPASGQCNKLEKEIHIQTQGKADTIRVWWGDDAYEQWDGDQGVVLRKHRYKNDTTTVKYFPLVLAAENVCQKDTTLPVAVAIYPQSVKAKVILDTNYRDECYGVERGFENKSFGFAPAGYRCEWQFEGNGDIVSDNRAQVTHLFATPGLYQVKLRVYDNCNEDIDSVAVRVHGNDSLDFTVNEGIYCSGKEVRMKFVQHGTAPFGDFRWEFQNGDIKSGSEIIYTFASSGVQAIKLTAIADGCRTSSKSKTIQVNKSPEPQISKPDEVRGCQPFKVEFEGQNANSEVASALWDFKDKASSSNLNATKIFEKAGTYNVSFKLTTTNGCVDSAVIPIQVLPVSLVDMKVNSKLFCTESGNFGLICLNVSPEKEKSSFEWWKGNEVVSLQKDSIRLPFYNEFGDIVLKLRAVHQESGCVTEKIDTIVSAHQVKADLKLEHQSLCQGIPVRFINNSLFSDFTELDLGDGLTTEENDFEYIYEEAGEYRVSLNVASMAGCRDTLIRIVKVNPVPEANFAWNSDNSMTGLSDDLQLPDKVSGGIKFNNLSRVLSSGGDTLKYEWNFGDNTDFSYAKSPGHLYPNNGDYSVTLHATTVAGCKDSVTDVVFISAIKGLYIPTAFVPAVADEGVSRFQPKGIGLYEYKITVFDNWGTCVWKSEQLEAGQPAEWWDGTFNGTPLPGGLYKWKVSALFKDGTVREGRDASGVVLLIR